MTKFIISFLLLSSIILAQSVAFTYVFNEQFTFGFSAAQKYNTDLIFSDLKESTIAEPEGIARTASFDHKMNIYSVSAIAAMDLEKAISGLIFGLRFNYDRLKFFQKLGNSENKTENHSSSFAIGLSYKTEITFGDFIIATYYEKGADIIGTYNIDGRFAIDTTSSRGDPFFLTNKIEILSQLPNRWHFGVNFKKAASNFLFDLTLIDWSVTGNYRSAIEYSSSYCRQFSDDWYVSFGVFSTDRRTEEQNYFVDLNNFGALFITLGAKTSVAGYDLDIAIADSHFASDSRREQTIFSRY